MLDIYDVERIEVLRGPQGTLYGRNTVGGAVKYVTRRLGADPTVSLRATAGHLQAGRSRRERQHADRFRPASSASAWRARG